MSTESAELFIKCMYPPRKKITTRETIDSYMLSKFNFEFSHLPP